MASEGIIGFGTTVTGGTTGAIGHLTGISLGGIQVGEADISTMESTGRWSEFVAAMKNAGTIDLDLVFAKSVFSTILDAVGGANETWTILFPDGSTFVCSGFISGLSNETPMGDTITATATIKLSGAPTFVEGS